MPNKTMRKRISKAKHHKDEYADYNQIWKDDWKDMTSYGVSYKTRYRLILSAMKKYGLTRGEVLDVGCGDGTFLIMLKKKWSGLTLNGFDISSYAIQKNKDRILLNVGDLTRKSTLPKKKYDIIVCSEVLEHIEDYVTAVCNLAGMMNKAGHIIITSPFGMHNWTRHDDYARHIRRFERGELESALKNSGIRIIDSRTWGSVLYNAYYKHWLSKQDPKKIADSKSVFKKCMAKALYNIFRIDDLFRTRGRTIVIVGRKT